MDETDQKAPIGASSMTLPVDAFAYEVLHGARLTDDLFVSAMMSATTPLLERYPELALRIKAARAELKSLETVAEQVWRAEAKRAEGAYDPAVTAALEKAVDAIRDGLTGGMYNKADNALDAAARRVRALLEPPCTQTD